MGQIHPPAGRGGHATPGRLNWSVVPLVTRYHRCQGGIAHVASCGRGLSTCTPSWSRRALLGQEILVLPLHHPVRIAEDLATIDNLSNGRVWLRVGQGAPGPT
ncbi:MAG TPA: LLM class flavin-dependent oxidoreductase, partial [Candidatus Saccharimonadia bacterium]|nr:LLM class flavin-dependent oxidoreductase [Candidatus Saccharimonadia bacterium]